MVIVHRGKVGKRPSGGRYVQTRGKRRFEVGSRPTETLIGEETDIKVKPGKFGSQKAKVMAADRVNLLDPKTKKYSQAKVKAVVESPANRNYTRRNIMVKGTVVETEKGKARVTSRPGQDGTVNAVLI